MLSFLIRLRRRDQLVIILWFSVMHCAVADELYRCPLQELSSPSGDLASSVWKGMYSVLFSSCPSIRTWTKPIQSTSILTPVFFVVEYFIGLLTIIRVCLWPLMPTFEPLQGHGYWLRTWLEIDLRIISMKSSNNCNLMSFFSYWLQSCCCRSHILRVFSFPRWQFRFLSAFVWRRDVEVLDIQRYNMVAPRGAPLWNCGAAVIEVS